MGFDLEVVEENAEVYRVILCVALEGQVLLQHVDVCHIRHDFSLLQDLKQLLVPNLRRASRQLAHVALDKSKLEFNLVPERLRHIEQAHVYLLGLLNATSKLEVVVLHSLVHHALSEEEGNHLEVAMLLLVVQGQDLRQERQLL